MDAATSDMLMSLGLVAGEVVDLAGANEVMKELIARSL